jgi:hypothetical protein
MLLFIGVIWAFLIPAMVLGVTSALTAADERRCGRAPAPVPVLLADHPRCSAAGADRRPVPPIGLSRAARRSARC